MNAKVIAEGRIEKYENEWGIYDEEKDIWTGFEKIIQNFKENEGGSVKIILEEKKKNKNQKIIAQGFVKSIGYKPRNNEISIIFSGMPSLYQTGVINKKFYLIIEKESKEK